MKISKEVLEVQLNLIGEVLLNGCTQDVADRADKAMRATGYTGPTQTPDDMSITAIGGMMLLLNVLAAQGHREMVKDAIIGVLDEEILVKVIAEVVEGASGGNVKVIVADKNSDIATHLEGLAQQAEMDLRAKKYEEEASRE